MFQVAQPFTYYHSVANNNFVQALACLPESQWLTTSKRRWICARLGIFSPLLHIRWRGYGLRSGVVYVQALSAHGYTQECQTVLNKLMRLPGINRYKPELIHEFSKYNPSLALQVIDSLPIAKQSVNNQALKAALQYRQYKDADCAMRTKLKASYLNQHDYFVSHSKKHPDLILLHSNWLSQSATDRLNHFNDYQKLFNLPPLSLKSQDHHFNSLNVEVASTIRSHPLPLPPSSAKVALKTDTQPHKKSNTLLRRDNKEPLHDLPTKVSIIVTVYNAQEYIASTLSSLLKQSWRNIEVILVDDASTDNSRAIAQRIQKTDSRLILLHQNKNQGTYVAKNRALKLASGHFIICHDSDDWAHPLKIEKQVLPLLLDNSLMATTSSWVKVDLEGNFVTRMGYPYKRQNPSSLMFRRQTQSQLMQTCEGGNLWQPVRTGADSELYERFKLIFGKDSILHINKPLTLGGHHQDSLMNASHTGNQNLSARRKRLMYWETWRLQHINMLREGRIIR